MNVIFVEPVFPVNQREFVRALHGVGANVIGIGESHQDALDGELRDWLTHYEQVSSVCDEDALHRAVRWVQDKIWVDRIEATVEAHIMPVARVREACTIPGTSVQTAHYCRDKPAMKEVLRDADIPCAQSMGGSDAIQIRSFAERVGFPLIIKPRSGAGAEGTFRVNDNAELDSILERSGVQHGHEVAVEEFIDGHEAFYDTIIANGEVVHEFVSHYYPNVLEAMRTRWISPQFIVTNRIDSEPAYQEVKDLGRKVIEALDIGTSATHMEWFFGDKGLKFSEIGCRPPGVRAWDLYAAANDLDIYHEWASAIVHGKADRTASRRFAAGIVALRPDQDGIIAGYEGLDKIQQRYGEWLIDFHVPSEGTPTQPVEAGYMANAWIRLRHPDYDQLKEMLDDVGRTVQVRAR